MPNRNSEMTVAQASPQRDGSGKEKGENYKAMQNDKNTNEGRLLKKKQDRACESRMNECRDELWESSWREEKGRWRVGSMPAWG